MVFYKAIGFDCCKISITLYNIVPLKAKKAIQLDMWFLLVLIVNFGFHSTLAQSGCTCGNLMAGVDVANGKDLANAGVLSFADCCKACRKNPQCKAISIPNGTHGTRNCYLKSVTSPTTSGPVNSALMECVSDDKCTCEKIYADIDSGNDLQAFPHSTFEDCCSYCSDHYACRGFTIYRNVCYLKTRIHPQTKSSEVTSGVLKCARSKCYCRAKQEGKKIVDGKEVARIEKLSWGQCCDACSRNFDCRGVTMLGGVCHLNAVSGPMTVAAGAQAAALECNKPRTKSALSLIVNAGFLCFTLFLLQVVHAIISA